MFMRGRRWERDLVAGGGALDDEPAVGEGVAHGEQGVHDFLHDLPLHFVAFDCVFGMRANRWGSLLNSDNG